MMTHMFDAHLVATAVKSKLTKFTDHEYMLTDVYIALFHTKK